MLGSSFPQVGLPVTNYSLVSLLLIKDCLHCKLFSYYFNYFSQNKMNESMEEILTYSIPPLHDKDIPSPPITPSNRILLFFFNL